MPVSPKISTLESVGAILSMSRLTRCIEGESPTSSELPCTALRDFLQRNGFVHQRAMFGDAQQHAVEIKQAARLWQEVEDLHPQSLNRGVHAAVSGVDDRQRVRSEFLHPSRDVPAGQAGHLQVEDRAIERFLGQCSSTRRRRLRTR